ncbi:MAG: phosphoribosylglycinamide formyltransferase [Bacteroidales bacterium]|nr:phosphoribosylglycinamide formyltransferase [Bacteroidales bacterium]
MKKVAVFASGSGTNAQAIIEYLEKKSVGRVTIILCNKKNAYVLERVKKYSIPSYVFNRDEFYCTLNIQNLLIDNKIDFIVLAGFLWLIPKYLIHAFPNRIINIHPALLPKYGGKGMYGMHVHEAVIDNNEKESGITIHYVNEKYDDGDIIFQAKCKIEKNETPESLANKIHQLEHQYFPVIVEKMLLKPDNQQLTSGPVQ